MLSLELGNEKLKIKKEKTIEKKRSGIWHNTMDSQEVEEKELNIQSKNQGPKKVIQHPL